MNRHAAGAAVPRIEVQHVLHPSFDRLDQAERAAALALASERRHQVAHLVADERLCAPIENGQEQTIAACAVGHGAPFLVDDLYEGAVLEEMLARELAFWV